MIVEAFALENSQLTAPLDAFSERTRGELPVYGVISDCGIASQDAGTAPAPPGADEGVVDCGAVPVADGIAPVGGVGADPPDADPPDDEQAAPITLRATTAGVRNTIDRERCVRTGGSSRCRCAITRDLCRRAIGAN